MFSRRINMTLARIRMQCSELLYHLYQNHVADSSKCPCVSTSTNPHSKLCSFGDAPSGNLPELVIAVEKFITTTQRFTLTMLNLPD